MNLRRSLGVIALAPSLLLAIGCSGGGGAADSSSSGTGVSFSLPSSVEVLKVETAESQSLSVGTMAYNTVGSDYALQPQNFHVSHPVGESLETVSSIMCFIGQLGVGEMWSEAALPRIYLVGVDDSKCESDSGGPSEGAASGGSTSSAAVALTMVTVRLSREAPGQYPRAEIWFEETDGPGGSPMQLRASIDVTQEPDATYPYGRFKLNFAMVAGGVTKGGGSLVVSGSGAAPIAYTFFESFSDGGQTMQKAASVEMQADGSSLRAAVESINPWDGNSAWVVATNATSVKANSKKVGGAAAGSVGEVELAGGLCLSTQNFKYRIFGYGLYNDLDGSKVSLNTGVSCQYTDGSGVSRNCHIGRHGAWFENESNGSAHTFAHGDTVTRRAWGADSALDGQQLTMFVSSGRLMKYTVKKYTLDEVRGMEMRMFDSGSEYIIKYLKIADGVAGDGFYKVATMTWNQNGPPSKADVDPAVAVVINNGEFKWFYSDALGGVSYVGGKTAVTARLEQMVVPGAAGFAGGEMALKCLGRCPKSGITQPNLAAYDNGAGNGPYVANPADVNSAVDYLVTETDMVLHKGATSGDPAVALANGVSFTEGTSVYQWGLESGAMVPDTTGMADLYAIYDTEGASYYQYRMGPNNWDKLVLVKNPSNQFLSFDEPLSFDYTHATANDRNGDTAFNGKKFLLRYHGEGHIEGFPWDQVDRDGDGTPDMWFPQVSLNDGVQLSSGGSNYRVKAMFGDITLTTNQADCATISTLSLPSTSVPSAKAGDPSNISTDKPDHGSCQYDTASESASAGCS